MRWFLTVVLYTAVALGANTSLAENANLLALREGSMKKLVFSNEPAEVSQIKFVDAQSGEHSLQDWQGKYVIVNFWATWCAPCRKEMPSLEKLQAEYGGGDFDVLTIATTRNTLASINKFYDEIGVEELPILLDSSQKLARGMGVLGLPTSLLLNRDGQEIARLRGDADWYSDSARAIIKELLSPTH